MMTRALLGAAGLGQLFHHSAEGRGRNGQIIGRALRGTEFLAERLKRRRVIVIAIHIAQQSAQFLKRRRIESAVFFQAVLGPGLELVKVPARLGHADDRHVEVAAFDHRLQRRENFLVGQIARGPEKHQRVGMSCCSWLFISCFFQMPAKTKAHRRKQFVLVIRLAARSEPFVERRGQHRHRHAFINRRLDRPAAFAGIGHAPGEFRKVRVRRPARWPSGPAATRR